MKNILLLKEKRERENRLNCSGHCTTANGGNLQSESIHGGDGGFGTKSKAVVQLREGGSRRGCEWLFEGMFKQKRSNEITKRVGDVTRRISKSNLRHLRQRLWGPCPVSHMWIVEHRGILSMHKERIFPHRLMTRQVVLPPYLSNAGPRYSVVGKFHFEPLL